MNTKKRTVKERSGKMPDILENLLQQVAVYWPPLAPNKSGRRLPDIDNPREVFVRWNWRNEDRQDIQGHKYVSTATVLHEDVEIELEGFLWLSPYCKETASGTALANIPSDVNRQRIMERQHIPDIDNDEQLYKAIV